MQNTNMRNWSWENIMCFGTLYADSGRRNPVWSGKDSHWSLRAETLPVETDDKVHDSDHESENSANEEDELQESAQPMPIRPTFGTAPITNAYIYVNEDLTKLRATLFWKARKLLTDRKLRACWTWDGRIMVQTHNGKIVAITREYDLKQ